MEIIQIGDVQLSGVSGWNRETIADGVWLNDNTIKPMSANIVEIAKKMGAFSAGYMENAGKWLDVSSTLLNNSGVWVNAVDAYGDNYNIWNDTTQIVSNNSANWNAGYDSINTNSANWENTYNSVNNIIGDYDTVRNNSANWSNKGKTLGINLSLVRAMHTTGDEYLGFSGAIEPDQQGNFGSTVKISLGNEIIGYILSPIMVDNNREWNSAHAASFVDHKWNYENYYEAEQGTQGTAFDPVVPNVPVLNTKNMLDFFDLDIDGTIPGSLVGKPIELNPYEIETIRIESYGDVTEEVTACIQIPLNIFAVGRKISLQVYPNKNINYNLSFINNGTNSYGKISSHKDDDYDGVVVFENSKQNVYSVTGNWDVSNRDSWVTVHNWNTKPKFVIGELSGFYTITDFTVGPVDPNTHQSTLYLQPNYIFDGD